MNAEDIKDDLTPGKGRPEWIFSAYGPGRQAPAQLFGGPERERSFEEMRAEHYSATAAGNPQIAVRNANELYMAAEAQMRTILNDLEGAIKYIIDGANQHPNRIDITEGRMQVSSGQQGTFGVKGTSTQALGLNPPSSLSELTPKASHFGQPSSLEPQSQLPFGKPALNQLSGQVSALGSTGPLSGMQPAFGQPSTFKASPFAQQLPQATAQGQFNQATTVSPFTQPSNITQATGQSQLQPHNPFGQPFPSTSPAGPPVIQQPPTSGITSVAAQDFRTATADTRVGDTSNLDPLPKARGETRHDPTTKRLILWKGQPTKYINNEPCFQHPDAPGVFVHIYFPNGPPPLESFKSSVGNPEQYTPDVETAYRHLKEHGTFKDGVMPYVPPRPEWCSFDL